MNYPDDSNFRNPPTLGPHSPPGPYGQLGPYGGPGPYNAPGGYGAVGPYGAQDPLRPPMNVPYKFTREELQVLKQCNRESFYGRCVPLMAALGLGAYYGVHLGYVKGNPKYGSIPKVVAGLVAGFVGGKLSYKNKCEEKILALPGGKLKETILARRNAQSGVLQSFNDGLYNDASLSYAMPYVGGNLQSNEARSLSDMDTDRPYDSFDDSFRSRNESDSEIEQLPINPPSHSVTYDELRLRNREEYENRRKLYRSGPLDDYAPQGGAFAPPPAASRESGGSYAKPQPPMQSVQSTQEPIQLHTTQPRSLPQRKNLYGDVVEK